MTGLSHPIPNITCKSNNVGLIKHHSTVEDMKVAESRITEAAAGFPKVG